MNRKSSNSNAQRGATLVIAMIMLILITLFVLAAVNMSSINFKVMSNEQARNESIGATQQAIEQVISTNFPTNPQPVTVNVDINGDGNTDYTANIAKPTCLNSVPIKTDDPQLSVTNPNDIACFASSASSTSGIVPAVSGGNSLCSNTQWDVKGTVTDTRTGSSVNVHQGVGVRVAVGTAC